MSPTTTSGWWASALRSRSSASPACVTTSNPASASRRAMPSRISTSSSPTITRTGAGIRSRYPIVLVPVRIRQQPPQRRVRQILLGDERAGPGRARTSSAPAASASLDVRRTRGRHGRADSSRASSMPSPSGNPTSTSTAPGRSARAAARARGDALGLPHHRQPAGDEHPARQIPEHRVVVHHQHTAGHRPIFPAGRRPEGRDNPRLAPARCPTVGLARPRGRDRRTPVSGSGAWAAGGPWGRVPRMVNTRRRGQRWSSGI